MLVFSAKLVFVIMWYLTDVILLSPPPQVLGAVGALPAIFTELEISYFLLRRLLGVRTEGDKRGAKVRGGTSEE